MESYLCREDASSKELFFLSRKQCVSSVFFRRLTTNASWLSLKGRNIAYVINR